MSNDPAPAAPADSWRIRIYCEEPIGDEPDAPRTWIADLRVTETGLEGWSGADRPAPRRGTPRWVDSDATMIESYSDRRGEHTRLRLPCTRCGRSDIYREDRLHQFLLTAAQHGVAELSLRAIATTLPKH